MYNNPSLALGLGSTATSEPGLLEKLTTSFTGLATAGMSIYTQVERAKASIEARKRAAEQEAQIRQAEADAAKEAARVMAQQRIIAAQRAQAGFMGTGIDTTTILTVGGIGLAAMFILPQLMKGRAATS